jgi:hypothetical protein
MTDLVSHRSQPLDLPEAQVAHALRVIAHLDQRYPGVDPATIDTFTSTLDADQGRYLTWDLTRAKAWLQAQLRAGRAATLECIEMSRDQMERMATTWAIDEAVVETADPTYPGLAAPIVDPDQPGVLQMILIDGVHRATKAYREGISFEAFLLPDDVSRECLLEAPEGSVP